MKKKYLSTRQVAERLGIRTDRLSQLVYRRSIREPSRGPSGFFLWTAKDVARAEKFFADKKVG